MSITLFENVPPEKTRKWDEITLIILCIAILTMLLFALSIYIKRNYPSLKSKNPLNVILMSFFGIIHIIGVFFTHEHFKIETSNGFYCYLFPFWIQYFFGLTPWFIILVIYQTTYIWVFSPYFENTSKPKRNILQTIIIILILFPMFILCLGVSLFKGTNWNSEYKSCETKIEWKIALLFIVLYFLVSIYILNNWVKSIIDPQNYRKYEAVNSITVLSIGIIIVNAGINLIGLLVFSVFRSISTCLIIFLHLYSLYAIAGNAVINGLNNNSKETSEFMDENENPFNEINEAKELFDKADILNDFMECAYLKKVKCATDALNRVIIINPVNEVDFFYEIVKWKKDWTVDAPFDVNYKFMKIYKTFIKTDAKRYVPLKETIKNNIEKDAKYLLNKYIKEKEEKNKEEKEEDFQLLFGSSLSSIQISNLSVNKNEFNQQNLIDHSSKKAPSYIFNDAIDWIPNHLNTYYGDDYIKNDVLNRNIYIIYKNKKISKESQNGILNRKIHLKLMDVLGIKSLESSSLNIIKSNSYSSFDLTNMSLNEQENISDDFVQFELDDD